MGHRDDLLVTRNLSERQKHPICRRRARGSVRRASGFVQIPITLKTPALGEEVPFSIPMASPTWLVLHRLWPQSIHPICDLLPQALNIATELPALMILIAGRG